MPDDTLQELRNKIATLQRESEQYRVARDEAHEQQIATTDILRVISESPTDILPVLNAILENGSRICNAQSATAYIREDDVLVTRAQFGPLRSSPIGNRARLNREWVSGRAVLEARTIHVHDLASSDEYPYGRERALQYGHRAVLAVPLVREGAAIGTLLLRRQKAEPFTDRQIALIGHFASQAVIAIANTRLFTKLRESREQQTATADILRVISQSPTDVQPVLEAVAKAAVRFCGAEDVLILLRERNECVTAAHQGPINAVIGRRVTLDPTRSSNIAIIEARTTHLPDIMATDPLNFVGAHSRAAEHGFRAIVTAPMLREGTAVGAIVLRKIAAGAFTPQQIELLETFAAQAVIAIENVRLFTELRQRTEEVAELNRDLEARVAAQVEELGRVGRLKRFLAPKLAELIVSKGDEKILESHRREIVVVFCDLRGYTAFSETAEPEEVLDFLREYHGALGPLVSRFEGTLDQFSGDGIMVFFNDPVPISNPAERAIAMAVAMREAASTLIAAWRERGRNLGFGAGIAQGYATLGQIGFSERSGYTAIGTVCNVAARLCGEAKDGQILLTQRVNMALKGSVATEQVGVLALKGLIQPVVAYNVPLTISQPALRVIAGGPPNK